MTVTRCDICGKEFNEYDLYEDCGIHHTCGYGSKHDGHEIKIDMCIECFDKLIDNALENVIDKDACVNEDPYSFLSNAGGLLRFLEDEEDEE